MIAFVIICTYSQSHSRMDFSNVYTDDIGRCYCNAHRREHCNECMLSFESTNKIVEEQIGLRKPPTNIEVLADKKVMLERSIAFMMDWEDPKTEKEQLHLKDQTVELERVESALVNFRSEGRGNEVDIAVDNFRDKAQNLDLDRRALVSAYTRKHPGVTSFVPSNEEAQELYDKYASKPPSAARDQSVDPYTCSYCQKHSTTKLKACARCQKQAYCSKDCQRAHWKGHKKECQAVSRLPKSDMRRLPLTFAQLQEFQIAQGEELEVRFIQQEPGSRLIALSKDRTGVTKRVVAYTKSGDIPGYQPGTIMRWQNPRIHCFEDGSSGVRIEEDDLQNIVIEVS